jgi:tetratricopeptide (TPR) repeat protein
VEIEGLEECPPDRLQSGLAAAAAGTAEGLTEIDLLIRDYPEDARLHFMRGSLLASEGRFAEGILAIRRAIGIAPGYDLARFQLGLLELSSGEGAAAEATLSPLEQGGDDDPFRSLAAGLRLLMRDEFEGAVKHLRRGMELNNIHPLINRDMQLIIDQVQPAQESQIEEEQPVSATQLLLQQFAVRSTRH